MGDYSRFLFSKTSNAVEDIRTRTVTQGENSGITGGKKLAVMVPGPLTVADVDGENESSMEIEGKLELLQFWKL